MAAQLMSPITLDITGKKHTVITAGQAIAPGYIPVSITVPHNIIQTAADGLAVAPSTALSATAGNVLTVSSDGKLFIGAQDITAQVLTLISNAPGQQLVVRDGKLYVPTVDVLSYVSSLISNNPGNEIELRDGKLYVQAFDADAAISGDNGNLLRLGLDLGMFIGAADILSNEAMNLLGVSAVDGKVILKKSLLANELMSELLSSDTGQILHLGRDGRIVLTSEDLQTFGFIQDSPSDGKTYGRVDGEWSQVQTEIQLAPGEKLLTLTSTGSLGSRATLWYDAVTASIVLRGVDDQEISRVAVPTIQIIKSVQIVHDPEGQAPGDYLEMTFTTSQGDQMVLVPLADLVVVYTAGNAAIDISADDRISLRIVPDVGLEILSNGLGFAAGFRAMTDDQATKLSGIESGATRVIAGIGITNNNGVFNIKISDSVSTVDSTQAASSTAVKLAYDKAIEALEKANEASGGSVSIDASHIVSGILDIARLPAEALSRIIEVEDNAALLALTTARVQNGDVIRVVDTGSMYGVLDQTLLGSLSAFIKYSLNWADIVGAPDFAGLSSRVDANETNISALTGRVSTNETNISTLQSGLTATNNNVTNITTRVGNLEESTSETGDDITVINNSITALSDSLSGKVDKLFTLTTTAPLTGGGNFSANRTLGISNATTSAVGAVQLATNAEALAGSLATKALTPANLAAKITAGTATMNVGAALATGTIYLQYEA